MRELWPYKDLALKESFQGDLKGKRIEGGPNESSLTPFRTQCRKLKDSSVTPTVVPQYITRRQVPWINGRTDDGRHPRRNRLRTHRRARRDCAALRLWPTTLNQWRPSRCRSVLTRRWWHRPRRRRLPQGHTRLFACRFLIAATRTNSGIVSSQFVPNRDAKSWRIPASPCFSSPKGRIPCLSKCDRPYK